jgi:HD-like signal output (HDOD) protein
MTEHTARASNATAQATLALLWERVRRQGDMPGFTKAINAILSAMRGEDEQAFSMTQTVLSDPVLTQKVLRLANSGMYSSFGQRINTVSKAVLVLGTEAIGHLALGLKLIEELSATSPDSTMAHVEMEKAVLAGMVAQQVAQSAQAPDAEQAVVCSLLHTLGRMMITFYMPERWSAMEAQAGGEVNEATALAELGLSLAEIGRLAAEHWGLPANLIHGMRSIEPPTDGSQPGEPLSREDWVAALSTMASRCASSMWHDDAAGAEAVRELTGRFGPMLGVDQDSLLGAIERAKETAAADLTIAPLAKPAEKRAQAMATKRLRAEGNRVLMAGVADMREALASATPGQMMTMALETVFQGLTFTRAFGFLRNRRTRKYSARLGLGENTRNMLPDMEFDDAYEPNVFHASLNSDRVIFIEHAGDPKFAAKLPAWWKSTLVGARSFVILPLCAHGQPVGFLYGDWDDSFPAISLSQTEFALLNDLRQLVVRTVERMQQPAETPRTAT